MALSDVLNNLTGARDALVTAINNKGGTVATTATLRQCADAVTTLPEGGGCDFYLCTSVGSGTWTGRKAVLTGGVYVFESAETTGLTYSAVTPIVGNIYSADALVTVGYLYGQMPQSGLKFYASLKNSFVAETGQQFNESLCENLDGVVFGNVDGVPAATLPAAEAHAFYNMNENFTAPLSVSFWAKENCYIMLRLNESNSGSSDSGAIYVIVNNSGFVLTEAYSSEFINVTTDTTSIINHYCYVQSESSAVLYKNGEIIAQKSYSYKYTTGREFLSINGITGSIGAVRVYNRALSEDEVKILASEFSPVSGGGSSGSGGEDGEIYTGDLVAIIHGTTLGDHLVQLACSSSIVQSQDEVVWRFVENAGGGEFSNFKIEKNSEKWRFSANYSGATSAGGGESVSFFATFETSADVPWGASWENISGNGLTCEVSKA